MGQIDITDFVTNLINSITDEKIINKADKTYVDDNFVLNTLFEEQINLKSDIDHNHDDRYYTESEMDIKLSEIESSIVGASGFSVSIVDVLPESGEFNTIYLVPSESPTENNKYNNYIWTGTEYDEIGGASPADIDLSDYATLEYLTSELSKYATIATLNTELSKKANNDHTHDTRYYTESEVDDLFTQLNDILETKSDVGHTHIIDDISNLQSTLDNKAPSSHVHSRLVPTSIPEGADLNDYTTQGSFYCSANTIATTIQNSPSNQAFHLEVYKTADLGVRQVVYAFSTSNTYSWQRNGYNGNWTNWCEIIDINKVDSSLSSTSTNPVQNKIINTALSNKSDIDHTHVSLDINPDFNISPGNVSGGYNKIMKITIYSSYADMPISFKIHHRNDSTPTKCYLKFNPVASIDTTVAFFAYEGRTSHKVYIYKETANTFSIIAEERGTYQFASITDIQIAGYMQSKIGFSQMNERITELPESNITQCAQMVATSSWSGYMSVTDKTKLDGIATGANKTIVDTALSSTSTNPVQNKVVNAQLTSLNNNKANTNHTHNDYTATTTVPCEYGTVRKFKKNGWAFVVYENINISTLSMESWTEIADIGWSNQAGNSYTANFQTSIPEDRFRITADGKLSAMKYGDSNHQGHYGYIVYPTSD